MSFKNIKFALVSDDLGKVFFIKKGTSLGSVKDG